FRTEIKVLENKKAAIQGTLDLYDNLRSAGFDHTTLATLAETCKKYGPDANGALCAVNSYADLIDIQVNLEVVLDRKTEEEMKLKEAKQRYVHLQTVMDMCDTLLFDLSYSVSTIRTLHDLAKKYGRPEDVYSAVGRFGDLTK